MCCLVVMFRGRLWAVGGEKVGCGLLFLTVLVVVVWDGGGGGGFLLCYWQNLL